VTDEMFDGLDDETEDAEEEEGAEEETPRVSGQPGSKRKNRKTRVAQPPTNTPIASTEAVPVETKPGMTLQQWRDRCPKALDEAWPWILRHITEIGWMPEYITATVVKTTNTPDGKPQRMEPPIQGTQIVGDVAAGYSPSSACVDWILRWYHSRNPNQANSYYVNFRGLDGQHIVNSEPINWEKYVDIVATRRAMDMAKEANGGNPMSLEMQPWSQRTTGFQQSAPPAAPDPDQRSRDEELGYLRRVAEESRRAAAEGRPPQPVAPPPPAPAAPAKEEIATLVAQTVAAALAAAGIKPKNESDAVAEAVAAALAAAGIKPKTTAEAEAERDARLLASVATLIEARLGPAPAGTPVGAGAAPNAPPPTMSEIIQDAARRKAQAEEEIVQARRVLGVQDPPPQPDPPTEIVRDDEEKPGIFKQAFERIVTGIANDPLGAMGGAAAFVAPFLEGSPAGSLIAKGAAGAAEAARQKQIRDSVQMPSTTPRKGPSV
jgi:hypothetical protein